MSKPKTVWIRTPEKPTKSVKTFSVKTFKEELKDLINKHSLENRSDTPDYILAEYMLGCLRIFDTAIIDRTIFYERKKAEKAMKKRGRK